MRQGIGGYGVTGPSEDDAPAGSNRPVWNALEHITQRVASIDKALDDLADRLGGSVATPVGPAEGGQQKVGSPQPLRSALACRLEEHQRNLNDIHDRLLSLVTRLEV